MKRLFVVIALAIGLLCLEGTPAWASPTPAAPPSWSYNFTPTSSIISADAPGSGSISLTNEPTKAAAGSSDVVVTDLKVSSTAVAPSTDTFNSAGAWKVGLVLTDSASTGPNASTTMYFTGKFGGNFSASNANVTDTFTGKTSYTWTAQSGNVYTVTLSGYTPPGPPDASNSGSISAHVTVTPYAGGTGHPASAPEPSTLVLSCLGLSFAGLASWRKRRRSLAAMLA